MDEIVVSRIHEYLHTATKELSTWLGKMLPRVTDEWWHECVISNLSYAQRQLAEDNAYSGLDQLDLAALLRVTDKSWYDMRSFAYLPTSQRQCVRDMMHVRNNWSHAAGILPDKDVIVNDLHIMLEFFETVITTNKYTDGLNELIHSVETTDFSSITRESIVPAETAVPTFSACAGDDEIREKDKVFLVGEPDRKGLVFSVTEVNGIKKYSVFVDGDIRTFYDGQIQRIDSTPSYQWVDIATFQSNLTAYEINNPSAGSLYSLNAARIDFVPYQFRPALKMIKADEPKILISDSVGVGKTIEAGLIIKEMEARGEPDNILIVCPKPLVAERKWELEMKRFDEEFIQLDGPELRQLLSDANRDGEWPSRYNKSIIPYSILDGRVYDGDPERPGKNYGLLSLDPPPHFDLVIIDEAHHIRNGSIDKEKAYAYKCVRYFCEHARAVVMLTATPLQTSDDDLYTLLNLLRPDVVIDKDVFQTMIRPNEYIYRASHAIRGAAEGWQHETIEQLRSITATQWGENVIAKNPLYDDILKRLEAETISRDERVRLLSDVESLHSFNTMINRTRRRDIQDFCIRRSFTIESEFTPAQYNLYSAFLQFEQEALSLMHNPLTIAFLMSTVRRQAASCIFGLAPHLRDMIMRRFNQLVDDPDVDIDDFDFNAGDSSELMSLARYVLELADALPEDDPKFDSIIHIIEEKQLQENNKIILFSSFRHTLNYVHEKLRKKNYRVAQINGGVSDEDRRALRERFELDKNDPNALDILLFTEVGSEGLDYQFCDTMINYDLPWNPMRIEQRIGRIDRRGQKSDAVNIYNVITAGTVDADIYTRCLLRIGIFEKSIGECEEILGTIGKEIERIALDTRLTEKERHEKLEQMADNEVRRMQELSKLEDEEHALFGFDLSNYTASQEIKDAESPWISPLNIQKLVERYLNERLGVGQYIIGNSDLKQLRLGQEARMTLLEDFRKMSKVKSALKRKWELYLKGSTPFHKITFVSETATKEHKAFFITPMHPLVKQAAQYFATDTTSYIHLEYSSTDLPVGSYPFSVYAWSYIGLNPTFKIVPICENAVIQEELNDLLQEATASSLPVKFDPSIWEKLEGRHVALWQEKKTEYVDMVKATANFKLESIGSSYRNQKRTLERMLMEIFDEHTQRIYQGRLESATQRYNTKVDEINQKADRADIHVSLISNGILDIRR